MTAYIRNLSKVENPLTIVLFLSDFGFRDDRGSVGVRASFSCTSER